TVIVRGEVERPGEYPILADETRLLDVIELAGGLTDQASLSGSRIWHVQSDQNLMAREVERLDSLHYQLISRAEVNLIRDFRRTLRRDFIPVDFVELFGDDEEEVELNNIALFDSLVINIPKKVYHVLVIGAVEQPGYYDFQEDWKYKDYIKFAGGYLKEADKRNVRIMTYERSQFLLARNGLKIQSGDAIYIPEKWLPTFWSTFRMYLGIFLQTATIAILIITNT
ncbi:MAG TPA: hypothetical protein ENH10_03705, partial [Bacteroidetes bacterium]|nr:hypothetical protein [Bacteroidota bacterium]HEX04247.1 hypothetical protein [Bacteroidota bacterium]